MLLHNGEPFLPIGWFVIPVEEMARPHCPYTAGQDYGAYWRSVEKNREMLDACAAAGKVLTIYPYPSPKMFDPASVWGQPLSDEEAEDLRQRAHALKDHQGLFAWYMADEPEVGSALPERMRRIYEVVTEEDPYHPCIMLNDTIAIDIRTAATCHARPVSVLCEVRLPRRSSRRCAPCRPATRPRRAARPVDYAAGNCGDWAREQLSLTFDEPRNMTYQAVIEARKVSYYKGNTASTTWGCESACLSSRERPPTSRRHPRAERGDAVQVAVVNISPFGEKGQGTGLRVRSEYGAGAAAGRVYAGETLGLSKSFT